MKKKALVVMAAVVCLMFLMGMATKEAGAVDINFDGFCDGMSVNIDLPRIWGMQIGSCVADPNPIIGNAGVIPGEGVVLTVSVFWSTSPDLIWTYYIRLNGTWSNYYTDGSGPPVKLYDGTWSLGTPAADAAGLPSSGQVE